MSQNRTGVTILALAMSVLSGVFYLAAAKDGPNKNGLPPVTHAAYKEACGACHVAYQPELMPKLSWTKILSNLNDHFGVMIRVEGGEENTIADYLKSNSAESSHRALSVNILKSLGNQIPSRITDIPYLKKHHREIPRNVIDRESIGSLSNCIACHVTAEKGIYQKASVKIPQ